MPPENEQHKDLWDFRGQRKSIGYWGWCRSFYVENLR